MHPPLHAKVVIAERYELVEPVADRGLGETWRVTDRRREGARRSMKFLKETPDGALPEGALAAVRALKALRHGAIPTVLQHGVHAGRPWVLFDDVRGESVGTLLDRARSSGELPDLALLRWVFDGIAGAMEAAHAASLPLTHGALTPGSVIVLAAAARGVPCALLDLGLAPWLAPPSDAPARSARMLVARAPELHAGAAATVATDVFALGALWTEMLALPAPAGATMAAVTAARRRPDVPVDVWRALETALSAAPGDRFESVASLTAALDAAWRFAAPAPRAAAARATANLLAETALPALAGPSLAPSGAPPRGVPEALAPLPVTAPRFPTEANPWSTQVLQREVAIVRPRIVAAAATVADPMADPFAPVPQGFAHTLVAPSPARSQGLVTPHPAAVAPPVSSRRKALVALAGLVTALAVVAVGALHGLLR